MHLYTWRQLIWPLYAKGQCKTPCFVFTACIRPTPPVRTRDRRRHASFRLLPVLLSGSLITLCRSTPVSYKPWWRLCPLLSTSALTHVITCYVKPSMPLLPTPLPYRLPLLSSRSASPRVNGSAGLHLRGRLRRRQADRCPRAARSTTKRSAPRPVARHRSLSASFT